MNYKELFLNRNFVIVLMFSIVSMILKDKLNGLIFCLSGLFIWMFIYSSLSKYNSEVALIKILIYSVPLSFVNILNKSYGDLPISWYNLFFIIIIFKFLLISIKSKEIKFGTLSVMSLFIIMISLLPLIRSFDLVDGIKQYINISTSFVLIIVANNFKSRMTEDDKKNILLCYLESTIIAATTLCIQFIIIRNSNYIVGNYLMLGGSRETFSALFSDFSFLSLYIISGATLLYSIRNKVMVENRKIIILISFLVLSSLLTSARTGLAAFLVVIITSSCIKFLKLLYRGSIKILWIIIANITLVIMSYTLLKKFRPEDMFADSGRMKINILATKVFLDNPILGVGFGVSSYGLNYGMIPHNILFQIMAQGGVILTSSIIFFLLFTSVLLYVRKKDILLTFMVIIVGSLFIPDIFNSRFLAVILLIVGLDIGNLDNI